MNLDVNDITTHWRLNVDLFVAAFQCDLTRVGVASFLNVGDRIDLRGRYEYEGKLIYEVTGVIHMLGPGGGRFKVGGAITKAGDGGRPAADLYTTVLRAYGIANRVIAPGVFKAEIPEIRAV